MIDVILQQHGGIAAMIILVARLFARPHPGRRLRASRAGGKYEKAKQNER
jgi:hypothetical protein